MLNTISIDIPQLSVDAIQGSSVHKEEPDAIKRYFINNYLNENLNQLNARHELINSAIRSAYFIHQDCLVSRQASGYYETGQGHYLELAYIDCISLSLIQSTVQLTTLIHFMNQISKANSYPTETGLKSILQRLADDPSVWNDLSTHEEFFNTILQMQYAFASPFAHSNSECLLTDNDPAIFIPMQGSESYTIKKISLRMVIDQYQQFLKSAKAVLQQCSPDTIKLLTHWN